MAGHKATMPRAEGQEGRDRQAGQSRERSGAAGAAGARDASGGASAGQRDQERQREVSREEGSAGTGMQRGGTGRQQSGGALATRGQGQPSLLPAFMASPGLMASAFMSDPFTFAQAMSDEMDRLFASYGFGSSPLGRLERGGGSRPLQRGQQGGFQRDLEGGARQWMPPMEVFRRGDELVVRADLPGLSPDDVHIDIEDGMLTLSGERRQEQEDRQEGWYRSERSYGAFSRTLALPEGVDEEQVQARFDQGVLEVTIPVPSQKESRGRRVQIQSGSRQSASEQRGAQGAQSTQSSQSSASSSGQGRSTTSEKR